MQVPENFLFVYKAPQSVVQRMQPGRTKSNSQAAAVDQLLRADEDVEEDIDEEAWESDMAFNGGWPDLRSRLPFQKSSRHLP